MKYTDLSVLKIHKMSQEQYEREKAAGNISENEIYVTPHEGASDSGNLATVDKVKFIGMTMPNSVDYNKYDGVVCDVPYSMTNEATSVVYSEGTMMQRIPIVAGENVTFEVDNTSKTIKINATGGSAPSSSVSEHNISASAHADIREAINQLSSEIVDITPVKGEDYWTAADKAEIKSYVDEAILNGAW